MINVYDIGTTNYDALGNAVLMPTEAKVRMVAGGNYDMTMTHPIDPEGKWKHLVPEAIIKIPVPEEEIENAFSGYAADVYKTTGQAELREEPIAPSVITYPTWPQTTAGSDPGFVGMKTSYEGKNYRCDYWDPSSRGASHPPSQVDWWTEIARYTSGAAVLVTLPAGTELYLVEDVDSTWYKMSYCDIEGYILKSQVTFYKHLDPSETKPRIITEQLLRITNATVDTKSRVVNVTAQHVSYDLAGIIVQEVNISQASPAMALGKITEGLMVAYNGTIATNLESSGNGTYTETIKGKNGIYCLLDPDKGIVSQFNAAFKRDNWDMFVLTQVNVDRGFRLEYGKNMLGVNWARKNDSLITRVVPVAKDEGGNDLYLPEKWIDSARINLYPRIRMERLTVKGQVGKDKGLGDDSVWTLNDLYTEMRTKAAERFSVDRVDLIEQEVTIEFEMMGDTAEYAALKKLENVLLYDTVTAKDETIGLEMQLTVTELEWDPIRRKVTALKLSNVGTRAGRNVTGYNVQSKSIGSDKLSDDVTGDLLNEVRGIIPEYAEPGGYTLPLAANGTRGGVQVGYTQSGQNYPVQLSGEMMYVNVPWTDHYAWNDITDKPDTATRWPAWSEVTGKPSSFYTLPLAANGTRGGVQVGYTQSGKNYPVQLSGEKMYVNVPWTDHYAWNDITDKPSSFYTLPLAANGTRGGVQTGYTQNGKNYPVQLSSEKMYVNVPWTDVSGNDKIPLKTNGGLGNVSGGGSNNYFLLATLTVISTYANYPVVFEVSRREYGFQRLQVVFKGENNTDPALGHFSTDGNNEEFWIVKTATSTWKIYGKYNEVWGYAALHRITGSGYNSLVSVQVEMTNAGTTAPGGTQASRFWNANNANNANYATLAGTANAVAWANVSSKPDTATRWPAWSEVTDKPTTFYTLPLAANGTRGGVQIGYTQSGKNYPVQLSGEKMYVNVPWTDHYAWSDITGKPSSFYSLPLAASGTRGGVQIGYTQSGKNYPVQLSSEKMYVNVPWTDTLVDIAGADLKLQIRTGTFVAPDNTDTYVQFSSAFTNACLCVMAVPGGGFNALSTLSFVSQSKAGATFKQHNELNVSMNVSYLAIGY